MLILRTACFPERPVLILLLLTFAFRSALACPGDEGDPLDRPDSGTDPIDSPDSGDSSSPFQPGLPLGELIDLESLRETATLSLVIEQDRTGQVPGDFEDPVWQIGFRFTSQTFLSVPWTHRGFLLLPQSVASEPRLAGIVEHGTENTQQGISDASSFLPQFGAVTADRLDLPILLLDSVPAVQDLREEPTLEPYQEQFPHCFIGPIGNEELFEECLRALSRATGRLDIDPTVPVAIAYLRAVTLLEELARRLPTLDLGLEAPPFEVERVAILAGGFDGIGLRHAMALDRRIEGVMVAINLGSWREFHQLQAQRWDSDWAFGDPTGEIAFLDSPAGAEFLRIFDLSAIVSAIQDKSYLVAVGTNTTRYPLEALEGYREMLPADHSLLFVANYGDGFGSRDHLTSWRTFLAHLAGSWQYPTVEATFQDHQGNISVAAQVEGSALVGAAEIWYVQRHTEQDDPDYRDALWRSSPVANSGNELVGFFTPLCDHSAFFVRVVVSQGFLEGPVTSPVYLVTP
ncbi:MAG: hypothetical protein JW797_11460 [Bradymonadales bacterium]|nr:hypothetical protein [Bradymonadales bacterium]